MSRDYKSELEEKYPDFEFILSGPGIRWYEEVTAKCKSCGYTKTSYLSRVLGYCVCKNCNPEKSRKEREEEFFKEMNEKFGDRFDFSFTKYNGILGDMVVFDNYCGNFFFTKPKNLKRAKEPCSHCNNHHEQYTQEEWIEKAKKVHNGFYTYEKVVYKNCKEEVIITCPNCGDFSQMADSHLRGHGCKHCEQPAPPVPEIEGYEILEYANMRQPATILCKEHNIVFKQRVDDLKRRGATCRECSKKNIIGEKRISSILDDLGISYENPKAFDDLKDVQKLSYDFYLPNLNLLIEYNGIQHYKEIPFFHRDPFAFHRQLHHDWLKRKYAKDHNMELLIIPYYEFENLDKILIDKLC